MKPIDKFLENAKKMDVKIDSVVWQENGKLEEREINHFDLHELRSCCKLLIAMAYGIAIHDKLECTGGCVSLKTKVLPTLKKLTNVEIDNQVKEWTIRTLLTHSTGYEKIMLNRSHVETLDKYRLVDVIFSTHIKYPAGVHFTYNNVEPYLLSVFFQENFGIGIDEFIFQKIFKPLGIVNFEWHKFGRYCAGATGLYINYKDFHKIGQLLFNLGKFNDKQIVPKAWAEQMIKLQVECPDYYRKERLFPKLGAGYFTWLSRDGIVFRDGSNGQYIICDYNNNRLITIMSSQKDMSLVTECLREVV